MNLKEIKEMITLMNEHGIMEFQFEREGIKVLLKKSSAGETTIQSNVPHFAPAAPAHAVSAPQSPAPVAATEGLLEITSPMVGTFYRAASPEAESFVKIGSQIGNEEVVCIIEAMKVMNEIKSEVKGVITEILVENGEAVEFGQVLFRVKKV